MFRSSIFTNKINSHIKTISSGGSNRLFAFDSAIKHTSFNKKVPDPTIFHCNEIFKHKNAIGKFIKCMQLYKQDSPLPTPETTLNFAKALATDITNKRYLEYISTNQEELLWYFFCHGVQNCRVESLIQRHQLKHFQLLACIYSKGITCLDVSGLASEKYSYSFKKKINRFIQDILLCNPGVIKIISENDTLLEEHTKILLEHNQLVNTTLSICHNPNLNTWIALFFDINRYHPGIKHILANLKTQKIVNNEFIVMSIPILNNWSLFQKICFQEECDKLFKKIQHQFWGGSKYQREVWEQFMMHQHVYNYFNHAYYLTRYFTAIDKYTAIQEELLNHLSWLRTTIPTQLLNNIEITVKDYLDELTTVAKRLPPMTKTQKETAVKEILKARLNNKHSHNLNDTNILVLHEKMKQDLQNKCITFFSLIPDTNKRKNEVAFDNKLSH